MTNQSANVWVVILILVLVVSIVTGVLLLASSHIAWGILAFVPAALVVGFIAALLLDLFGITD